MKLRIKWEYFDDEFVPKKQLLISKFALRVLDSSDKHKPNKKMKCHLLGKKYMLRAINNITDDLGKETLSGFYPTIDCFPCDDGRKEFMCQSCVSKDFFAATYNEKNFWKKLNHFGFGGKNRQRSILKE